MRFWKLRAHHHYQSPYGSVLRLVDGISTYLKDVRAEIRIILVRVHTSHFARILN